MDRETKQFDSSHEASNEPQDISNAANNLLAAIESTPDAPRENPLLKELDPEHVTRGSGDTVDRVHIPELAPFVPVHGIYDTKGNAHNFKIQYITNDHYAAAEARASGIYDQLQLDPQPRRLYTTQQTEVERSNGVTRLGNGYIDNGTAAAMETVRSWVAPPTPTPMMKTKSATDRALAELHIEGTPLLNTQVEATDEDKYETIYRYGRKWYNMPGDEEPDEVKTIPRFGSR